MRIAHRVPVREAQSATLDPAYQAEVDRSTARAERAYAKALRDLQRAEGKLQRVQQSHDAKAIKLATAIVELRRQQLEELEVQMRSAPQSATHRGRRSYRPVPTTRGSLL